MKPLNQKEGFVMKTLTTFFVLCLLALTTQCATVSVQYDYDTKADFPSLRTYDWIPTPVNVEIGELVVARIKNAVNNQLEIKGLKWTSKSPDFLIAMHVTKKRKINIVNSGYGYAPYGRYWGGYWGHGGVSSYEYEEGTLILDFVDAKSNQMFWRGVAIAELADKPTPEKQEKRINKAVEKIFKQYPPQPKK